MSVGERVRSLRRVHHLGLRTLAEQIGVNYTYLSKIERGDMEAPSEMLLRRIAHVLETDEDELLNLAGKVPPRLRSMMRGNPLLTELVRFLSNRKLPDDVYLQMIQLARKESIE